MSVLHNNKVLHFALQNTTSDPGMFMVAENFDLDISHGSRHDAHILFLKPVRP